MLKYISLKEEHAKLIFTWRLMPHVTKFMLSDIDEDLVKHKKWVKSIINNKKCKYWLISFEGKYIGLVDLSGIDYVNKRCTVGYYIGEKEFVGLGALFLPPIYDYVFNKLRLNKIYGEVLEGNDLILGIHKYHGWRNVGTFNNHIYKDGKYYDVHLVELHSIDWLNYRTRKTGQDKMSAHNFEELF
jgi:UDP-4-amino-4,6-dideoxy-N-acetyl-beta-L-altrosamine N-acetyltransferase